MGSKFYAVLSPNKSMQCDQPIVEIKFCMRTQNYGFIQIGWTRF